MKLNNEILVKPRATLLITLHLKHLEVEQQNKARNSN